MIYEKVMKEEKLRSLSGVEDVATSLKNADDYVIHSTGTSQLTCFNNAF